MKDHGDWLSKLQE
jgi:hypothetical protein